MLHDGEIGDFPYHPRPEPGRITRMGPQQLHILVVEDHVETSDTLVQFLAGLGHWVETAPDAASTLERTVQGGFDCLLADILLPDASGWDMLSELARRDQLPPHVLSMSAADVETASVQSKAAGCSAHLPKPFKLSDLAELLFQADSPET